MTAPRWWALQLLQAGLVLAKLARPSRLWLTASTCPEPGLIQAQYSGRLEVQLNLGIMCHDGTMLNPPAMPQIVPVMPS